MVSLVPVVGWIFWLAAGCALRDVMFAAWVLATYADWFSAFPLPRLRVRSFVRAWANSPVHCRQEKGELTRWQSKNEFQYKDLYDMDAFVEDVRSPSRLPPAFSAPKFLAQKHGIAVQCSPLQGCWAAGRWRVCSRLELGAGFSALLPLMPASCVDPPAHLLNFDPVLLSPLHQLFYLLKTIRYVSPSLTLLHVSASNMAERSGVVLRDEKTVSQLGTNFFT